MLNNYPAFLFPVAVQPDMRATIELEERDYLMDTLDMLAREVVTLRASVFGFDRAMTDELAEYLHYEEEPQRDTENETDYKARQERVKARKQRLGTNKQQVDAARSQNDTQRKG